MHSDRTAFARACLASTLTTHVCNAISNQVVRCCVHVCHADQCGVCFSLQAATQPVCCVQGITTLLAEGPLAALPSLQQPAGPHVPLWIRRPAQAPSLPQQLLLRQAGQHSGLSSWRLPLRVMARRFCHHATFRGHGFPVFCVVFDKDGRRVVTGADDGAIKVSK